MTVRTIWRYALLCALLLCVLLCAVACISGDAGQGISADTTGAASSDGGETTAAETEEAYEITLSSAYRIVYPDEPSETVFGAASGLVEALFLKTGEFCEMRSDLVLDVPGYEQGEYEILIGACDRDVTRKAQKTLRSKDAVIAVIDRQVVIVGGNDALTAEAVTYFAETLLADGNVLSSGELYRMDGTYAIDTLTVGGVDIREFQIVYEAGTNSPYRAVAETLRDLLGDYCGYTLDVVDAEAPEVPYEFLIGDCKRAAVGTIPTDQPFTCGMLAVKNDGGHKIAFAAPNDFTIARALDQWFETHFDADATGNVAAELVYELKSERVTPGLPLTEGATMRVMSNNILSASEIDKRAPLLVDIYLEYFPDIIGFQEFPDEAHDLVYGRLSEFYGIVDTTIGDTQKKSRTPIFYRKDLYKAVTGETFFYASRWPKTNTKTLAWAVLEVKATGERFVVMNTHYAIVSDSYDTLGYYGKKYSNNVEGVQWRNDNSREVLETLAMLRSEYGADIPVFFMGDLNCNVNSEALRMVGEELDNAIDCATVSKSVGTGSSHTLGKAPSANSLPIDHVFVTKDTIEVYTHLILRDSKEVLDSSDHCPVICEVALK
ncbi:MAG: hypothetical protein J6B77_03545 [Clostridia bacterium]|nr:hypothetical protein [Clostridia bacterium]